MSISSTNRAAAEELVEFFRFKPTDEEVLTKFLKKKMQGKASHFPEIPCCKHEPWDLRALLAPTKGMEWFFSPRNYKYAKSKHSNRATVQGFWKITSKPHEIKDEKSQAVIGYKRFLTFYKGRVRNASKTDYIMHEYDLAETELASMSRLNGDFFLCRLKIKPDKSHKKKGSSISEEADPDTYIASNFENLPAADDLIVEQEKELEDPLLPSDNVGECKEPHKDSCLIDENDLSTWDYEIENQAAADDMISEQEESLAFKELLDSLFPNGDVGQCKESQKDSRLIDDISTWDERAFSDFQMQQAFAQPQEQQDYCSSTLQYSPKEAHLAKVPHADVNNGEFSWGQSSMGHNDSCLTNKNIVSTNDNHEPVSNIASNFGSATIDGIQEVFTQPGGNMEPLDYPLLWDYPLLSPMNTKSRDFVHGNNYIAGNELQSQFGDYGFLTIDDQDNLSYLQTTSPSIDSNLTQSSFNNSIQGNSALATGEKKNSSVANEP